MEKSGLSDRNSGKTENQKENGTLSNRKSEKSESQKENERSGEEASDLLLDAATDPMLPTEVILNFLYCFQASLQLYNFGSIGPCTEKLYVI